MGTSIWPKQCPPSWPVSLWTCSKTKTMSEALAPYELTGWTGRGKAYSYSVRVCGEGNFIEEENMPDAEKFSMREAMKSTDTAEERLAMWKATVLESMENLCQFMA